MTWLKEKRSQTRISEMEKVDFKEIRENRVRILWIETLKDRSTQGKTGGSSLTSQDFGSPPGL